MSKINAMRVLFAIAIVVAAACVPASGPAGSISPTPFVTPMPTSTALPPGSPATGTMPPNETPRASGSSLPDSITDPIVADAATRMEVAATDVIVVSAVAVTWPDRGLGCPLPGVNYPQVPVDGYQVVVDAGGQRLDYRGSGEDFRLCTLTRSIQTVDATFQRP